MSHLRTTSFLRSRPSIHEIANSLCAPLSTSRSNFSTNCMDRKIRCISSSRNSKGLPSYTSHRAPIALSSSQHRTFTIHSKPSSVKPPSSVPPKSSSSSHPHSHPPSTHDRGPPSSETTQTDFSTLDVLGNTPSPSTSIDACLSDGFHLNSGVKLGGDGKLIGGRWRGGSGVLLVGGEAFGWRPWVSEGGKEGEEMELVNAKGQFDCPDEAWGVLGCVWPRPDLLILGLGKEMRPISPKTRAYINGLGIRIEVADTRNAAAQFNLLATERGVVSVAAALVPIGR